MSETDELLDVVDSKNNVVGKATRGSVYKKGFLHRAVHIFILNSQGKVFLQKRSKKKVKDPLAWDLSAGEHLRMGESFNKAAERGLQEELGIRVPLQKVISLHRIEVGSQNKQDKIFDNELVETYQGIFDGDIRLNSEEVEEGKFFSAEQIDKMIKENKAQFTSGFIKEWQLFHTLLT